MKWILMPLRRYADFSGRSRRKEYWMFMLGYVLFAALIGIVAFMTSDLRGGFDESSENMPVGVLMLFGLLGVVLIVPSLAVQVRRFHDQDRSGWFVLMSFIPYIGGFIVVIFMCLPGTVGDNRFGADPKGPRNVEDVFA